MLLLGGATPPPPPNFKFSQQHIQQKYTGPSKNYNRPPHLFIRLKLCLIGKTSPQIKEQLSSPIIQKLVINLVDNELLSTMNYSLQIEQMLAHFKTKLLHFPLHSHSQATCLLPFSPQYCCQPHCCYSRVVNSKVCEDVGLCQGIIHYNILKINNMNDKANVA